MNFYCNKKLILSKIFGSKINWLQVILVVEVVVGALIFRHVAFTQMNPVSHLPSEQAGKLQG